MKHHGFRVRAKTTDRVVKVSEVLAAGHEFFANTNAVRDGELAVYEELVFNMDEFFTKLEDNHKWTWERIPVGGKKIIVCKHEKVGFTCSVLSSMSGEIAVFLIRRTTIREILIRVIIN